LVSFTCPKSRIQVFKNKKNLVLIIITVDLESGNLGQVK
jgi:hypothetical protein